jgi:hypothetical protein
MGHQQILSPLLPSAWFDHFVKCVKRTLERSVLLFLDGILHTCTRKQIHTHLSTPTRHVSFIEKSGENHTVVESAASYIAPYAAVGCTVLVSPIHVLREKNKNMIV